MDRGAWRTTVHGVIKSPPGLSDKHFHFPPLRAREHSALEGREWSPADHRPPSGSKEIQNRRSGPKARGVCPINPVDLRRLAQYAPAPGGLPTSGLLIGLLCRLPRCLATGLWGRGCGASCLLAIEPGGSVADALASGTMSMRTLPLLFLNLGGEMLYILDQRLRAQNIPGDKARKGEAPRPHNQPRPPQPDLYSQAPLQIGQHPCTLHSHNRGPLS